ncbi:MAG: hypothetical protein WAR21_02580 [Candidatus Acidiferrales bacterium]
MLRLPTRVLAVVILVFLIAAQVHVWVEGGAARPSGHVCQVCVSGSWAVVSATPGLEVALRALRLEAEPLRAIAKYHRTEASAPRAPPLT